MVHSLTTSVLLQSESLTGWTKPEDKKVQRYKEIRKNKDVDTSSEYQSIRRGQSLLTRLAKKAPKGSYFINFANWWLRLLREDYP